MDDTKPKFQIEEGANLGLLMTSCLFSLSHQFMIFADMRWYRNILPTFICRHQTQSWQIGRQK